MKQALKTIIQVFLSALSLISCLRQESASTIDTVCIPVRLEQMGTKVDVADNSGICTWTSEDAIGLYITTGDVGAYRSVNVHIPTQTVRLSPTLSTNQHISGYAVSPYFMRGNGVTPTVNYLTSYSLSDQDLTQSTFSYVPMMAAGDPQVLSFYHVGALIRLILTGVPSSTNKFRITFMGMTNVTGEATVYSPGTSDAYTVITTGTGNVVTFTDVTASDSDMFLNIPIPTQDYSSLTTLKVEAMSGNSVSKTVNKQILTSWGQIKHGWGRIIQVSF